jgi:hypothetical protein
MNKLEIPRDKSSITTRCAAVAAIAFAIISTSVFLASAGTLTPPGPPAATMRTLEEQKPAWNKIIPAAQRFVDALDGTAVLDKETGLVWAKTPDSVPRDWQTAMDYCTQLNLGGRKGWRLPTIEELASLVDMSNLGTPKLPAGHPFQNVLLDLSFWSSTTYSGNSNIAWYVFMYDGVVYKYITKQGLCYAWPVRSGQ